MQRQQSSESQFRCCFMRRRRYKRRRTNLLVTEYPFSRCRGYSVGYLSSQVQTRRRKPTECIKRQYFVVCCWSIYYRAFDQLGPATCTLFTPVETCSPPNIDCPRFHAGYGTLSTRSSNIDKGKPRFPRFVVALSAR